MPSPDCLAADTRRPRFSPPVRRPLRQLSRALLLGLMLLAGGCGGSGSTGSGNDSATEPPQSKSLASAQGQLLDYYRVRMKRWLAGSRLVYSPAVQAIAGIAPVTQLAAPQASATAAATAAPDSFSTTVVQEAGVDEDDLVKTDGNFIYSLASPGGNAGASLQVHQVPPAGTPLLVAQLPVAADLAPQGLLLDRTSNRLAMLSTSRPWMAMSAWADSVNWLGSTTRIDLFQLGGAAAPQRLQSLTIDGNLIGARRIGSRLYLATRWYPRLPVLQFSDDPAALAANRAAIDGLTLDRILPTLRIDDGTAQPLVAESDCFIQAGSSSNAMDMTALVSIDLGAADLPRTSRCFAGGSDAFYMSDSSLYLATAQYSDAGQASTGIHKFSVGIDGIGYRGSGEVPGSLGWNTEAKSYRFGEFQGDLRVITFTGSTGWGPVQPAGSDAQPPSPATLSVLRENAGTLQVIGSLPNARRPQPLGLPGQQVYATRFTGARAYLVTYRAIDPLYLVDLSDPTDPRQTGMLQAPGFSNYLYPLGERLLLGVGRSDGAWPSQRTRLALFDVSDPAAPQLLASRELGAGFSISALDYSRHGIMLHQVGNVMRAALPVLTSDSPLTGQQPVSRALYRWDINLDMQTMADLPALPAPALPAPQDSYLAMSSLAGQRALSIGGQVHYFADGQFVSGNW